MMIPLGVCSLVAVAYQSCAGVKLNQNDGSTVQAQCPTCP
jgi:hypothetical protein